MISKKILLGAVSCIVLANILISTVIGRENDSKLPTEDVTNSTEKEKDKMRIKAEDVVNTYFKIETAKQLYDWQVLVKYLAHENVLIRAVAIGGLIYPCKLPINLGDKYKFVAIKTKDPQLGEINKVINEITYWFEQNTLLKEERDIKISKLQSLSSFINVYFDENTIRRYFSIKGPEFINLIRLIPYFYQMCEEWPENETDWYERTRVNCREIGLTVEPISERDAVRVSIIEALLSNFELLPELYQQEWGIKNRKELRKQKNISEACEKVIKWFNDNFQYCYFHPEERYFKLDEESKSKNIPSEKYRKENPWGKDEGPNKTDPKKRPTVK